MSTYRSYSNKVPNLSNNPQKLDPPFILFPQVYELEGNSIIHIQVPASSQVHKTSNIVYDRSSGGDFKVTEPQQIANNYNRKRTYYTENIVYPYLQFTDFKKELFPKIRNLIRSNYENHPWLSLGNKQLLEKAGLFRRDEQTGKDGYTLAAGLLLGKDSIITQLIPHYKIDALVSIANTDRYDDRAYIQTNLIDAYEQLMDFVAKHLPDKFYLQGDQRVSLRSKIFREVVANLIVHREYTNAHPCTFVIFKDRVETQNANNQHGHGPINPDNFAPFTKNPAIAKFFIQLGRMDELGSGVLNVNRYIKEYSGKSKPVFFEGPVFKITIPIPEMNGSIAIGGTKQGVDLTKKETDLTKDGTDLPSNKNDLPSNKNDLPSNKTDLPSNKNDLPSNKTDLPSNKNDQLINQIDLSNKNLDLLILETIEVTNIGTTKIAKEKLSNLLKEIAKNEGKRVPYYQAKTIMSDSTIKRFLKLLKDAELIVFRGDGTKTGGYYLTQKMKVF